MARKSKMVKEEAEKAKTRLREEFERSQTRLREIEETLRLAEEEELKMVENTEKKINDACKESGMFCGVILSPEDLANVVILAINSGQNVKIPFKLYFNE